MKIHEYQARNLLEKFGIPVPPSLVVDCAADAGDAYEQLMRQHGSTLAVIKAQVHTGGRGKGGGVKLVHSANEARQAAERMLYHPLVTPQSGPQGVSVHQVLVSVGVQIDREFYLGITMDRGRGTPVLIASSAGGADIEETATNNPRSIVRQGFNAVTGLLPYQARKISHWLGFCGNQAKTAAKIMQQLSNLFLATDASLVEINPLVVTAASDAQAGSKLLAIDAKVNFDDSALFRHTELQKLDDSHEQDLGEQRAKQHGLSYIKLDGDIGCLVNGAGLAMATMDLIKLHGREPANFLDVGGSASEQAVIEAFRIILEDKHIKGVLVNIFGGIMQCDIIARAIVNAAKEVGFNVPLVVRLEGTNVEEARRILTAAQAQIPTMQIGIDLTDAAKKITTV